MVLGNYSVLGRRLLILDKHRGVVVLFPFNSIQCQGYLVGTVTEQGSHLPQDIFPSAKVHQKAPV